LSKKVSIFIFLITLTIFTCGSSVKADTSVWTTIWAEGYSAMFSELNREITYYSSLAIAPDGTPYVSHIDSGNDYKLTVMKYDNSTGNWYQLGNYGVSASSAEYNSLVIAPDGTPLVNDLRYQFTIK
jgi:hypothetical protein